MEGVCWKRNVRKKKREAVLYGWGGGSVFVIVHVSWHWRWRFGFVSHGRLLSWPLVFGSRKGQKRGAGGCIDMLGWLGWGWSKKSDIPCLWSLRAGI